MKYNHRYLTILLSAAFALIVAGTLVRYWLTSLLVVANNPIAVELNSYLIQGVTAGDMVILANNLSAAPDAVVNGDASLIAANLLVEGTVNGDLTAIAENLVLGETARITGRAALMGQRVVVDGVIDGDLYLTAPNAVIAESAVINGTIYSCGAPSSATTGRETAPCNAAEQARLFDSLRAVQETVEGGATALTRALVALASGVGLIGLSVLGITMFPSQIDDIEARTRGRLRDSFSAGIALLCLSVGSGALVVVLLGLIPPLGLLALIPFAFGCLLLLVLIVAGWLVAAHSLGRRVMRRGSQPPLIAVLVGGMLLTGGGMLLALLPGGEWWMVLGLMLVSAPGAGAALLWRLGSTPPRHAYFVQG